MVTSLHHAGSTSLAKDFCLTLLTAVCVVEGQCIQLVWLTEDGCVVAVHVQAGVVQHLCCNGGCPAVVCCRCGC